MKSQELIRKQLEEVYEHRLLLRVERKMKKSSRNCMFGISKDFDLGDFGTISRWQCQKGKNCDNCNEFFCVHTLEGIEKEMIRDISNPATCGAKQPKIAMLMWVLHDNDTLTQETEPSSSQQGLFSKIRKVFFK